MQSAGRFRIRQIQLIARYANYLKRHGFLPWEYRLRQDRLKVDADPRGVTLKDIYPGLVRGSSIKVDSSCYADQLTVEVGNPKCGTDM